MSRLERIEKTRRLDYYIFRRLEIMKLDYIEMLHAEFEVYTLNSMAVREIIKLDYKQIRRLEIMKLDYLEMLYAEFEVCSLNSMAVKEIIGLDYKQIRKIRKTRRLDQRTTDGRT